MKPQKFLLCFERTNARAGYVWSVKIGRRWIHAKEVTVHVPVVTVWRGSSADQPRAYLYGRGVVETSPMPGFIQIVPISQKQATSQLRGKPTERSVN